MRANQASGIPEIEPAAYVNSVNPLHNIFKLLQYIDCHKTLMDLSRYISINDDHARDLLLLAFKHSRLMTFKLILSNVEDSKTLTLLSKEVHNKLLENLLNDSYFYGELVKHAKNNPVEAFPLIHAILTDDRLTGPELRAKCIEIFNVYKLTDNQISLLKCFYINFNTRTIWQTKTEIDFHDHSQLSIEKENDRTHILFLYMIRLANLFKLHTIVFKLYSVEDSDEKIKLSLIADHKEDDGPRDVEESTLTKYLNYLVGLVKDSPIKNLRIAFNSNPIRRYRFEAAVRTVEPNFKKICNKRSASIDRSPHVLKEYVPRSKRLPNFELPLSLSLNQFSDFLNSDAPLVDISYRQCFWLRVFNKDYFFDKLCELFSHYDCPQALIELSQYFVFTQDQAEYFLWVVFARGYLESFKIILKNKSSWLLPSLEIMSHQVYSHLLNRLFGEGTVREKFLNFVNRNPEKCFHLIFYMLTAWSKASYRFSEGLQKFDIFNLTGYEKSLLECFDVDLGESTLRQTLVHQGRYDFNPRHYEYYVTMDLYRYMGQLIQNFQLKTVILKLYGTTNGVDNYPYQKTETFLCPKDEPQLNTLVKVLKMLADLFQGEGFCVETIYVCSQGLPECYKRELETSIESVNTQLQGSFKFAISDGSNQPKKATVSHGNYPLQEPFDRNVRLNEPRFDTPDKVKALFAKRPVKVKPQPPNVKGIDVERPTIKRLGSSTRSVDQILGWKPKVSQQPQPASYNPLAVAQKGIGREVDFREGSKPPAAEPPASDFGSSRSVAQILSKPNSASNSASSSNPVSKATRRQVDMKPAPRTASPSLFSARDVQQADLQLLSQVALQSQRELVKTKLVGSDESINSITVKIQPDGNCGFAAIDAAFKLNPPNDFLKQHIKKYHLNIRLDRQGFIGNVGAAISYIKCFQKPYQQRLNKKIKAVYEDAGVSNLSDWINKFYSPNYWANDTHFELISLLFNIKFEIYVIDPNNPTQYAPRGEEAGIGGVIYEGEFFNNEPFATIRLLHDFAGEVNPAAVESNNHFDLLCVEPTSDQVMRAQESGLTFAQNDKKISDIVEAVAKKNQQPLEGSAAEVCYKI